MVKELMSLQEELLDINVSVYLPWIPGHAGICANETADVLAKHMAQDIVRGRIAAQSHISMQSALNLSSEIAYNSWQQKWECDSSGFYTRLFLPQVRTKVTFPHDRDTGVSYCRMLLNDTLLNEDRFKTGLRESPMCDCNKERETISHFLLRCPHYEEIRNKLQNVVDDIWTSAKHKGHLQLSDNLLLAPTRTGYITKRMDRDIKLAFFNSSDQLMERFDPLLPSSHIYIYILVKTVTIVVTTPVSDSTMCLYFGGYSQLVASLHTEMLLLQLIPGATRSSTENNNNNNNNFLIRA